MRNTRKKTSNKDLFLESQLLLQQAAAVISIQDKVIRHYASGVVDDGVVAKQMLKDMGVTDMLPGNAPVQVGA